VRITPEWGRFALQRDFAAARSEPTSLRVVILMSKGNDAMTPTITAETPSALHDLKAKWAELDVAGRALAVHALHKAGVSFRKLAKELGCSPSLLRNLDKGAQASAADLELARKRKISVRELVRRAQAAEKQHAEKDKQALDQKQTEAAQKAAITICEWLEEHQLWPAHGENIVDEARRILAHAEYVDQLPKCSPPPSDMPTTQIISRTKPPVSVNPEPESVGWYADWLARWAYFAFPDPVVRDRALNIALHDQVRRTNPVPPKELGKSS
jgi:hypothetical protein